MSEVILKTAEEWENEWKPKGLVIHNHHGFGSGYMKDVDESYYTEKISLNDFKSKLMLCSLMSYPKELTEGEKKTYYRVDIDDNNYGVMPIKEVAEIISEHLSSGIEEGESCQIHITPKQLTELEYNNLPEVDL